MLRFLTLNFRTVLVILMSLMFSNQLVSAQDFYLFIGTYTQAKPDKIVRRVN